VLSANSDVNRGLAALQSAFREERPLEARLSDFSYAPVTNQRGGGSPKVDYVQRDRAATLLLNAVTEHPSAASHHALGKYYLAEHQFDKAIDQFTAALKLDSKNAKIQSDLGAALMEKGMAPTAESAQGRGMETFAESLEHLNKALELDSSLLEAYFNRALLYQYMRTPREAAVSWREYLKRDGTSPWADEAKRNLKLLEEDVDKTSWNPEKALEDFRDARHAGDDNRAWRIVSTNYTSAGNAVTSELIDSLLEPETASQPKDSGTTLTLLSYLAKLELNRSGDRYTSDLFDLYERERPERRQVLAGAHRHMKAGYALFTESKYAEAVGEYSEAKRQYAQTGDSVDMAFVDYRLAHCYLFLPALEKAKVAFKRLSAICESKEYRWLLAQCLYGLAHANSDNSEYTRAIDYSIRALRSFERADDLNGILGCLTQLADVNQVLNRIDRSLSYLSRGLTLPGETQAEPMQRWGILVQIAFSMSSKQRHAAALVYQKEALNIALAMGRPLVISRSYGYLGSTYAAVKMYHDAIGAATSAFETGKAMPKGAGGVEIMANASQQLGDIYRQASECNKAVKAYDRSIELYGSLNFEYYSYAAHKGKLFCLIPGSDDRTASEELQRVLDLSERYRSKITLESQRLSFFNTEQRVYDLAIYHEFVSKTNPVKAFEYSEASRARSLLDEVRQGAAVLKKSYGPDIGTPAVTNSMSLAEIQHKMPDGAQIIQYAVLDERLLIWVVNKSQVRQEEVNIRAELLNEKARAYLERINRPPTSDSPNQPGGEELYRVLIMPVEPFLDKSKFLCIVPDKILHYLPYNALISPTTGKYLIEDYDIGTAPSSSIFVYLTSSAARKAGTFGEKLLIAGDPRFSQLDFDSLGDLPSAAREVEAVSAFYDKPRVLLQEAATETSIKSEIEKVDVVHLAMHYVLNPRAEMLSGFPLTPEHSRSTGEENTNGFLQSYEIYDLNLSRVRLIVLSACQTGIEQQYQGEGAVSAARPFLVAGVPTVIASLWPVDSDASAELMANFHRHRVRDPLPVTQALRKAQIEMARSQDPRYRHPYYWAPFVAIGGRSTY
jgi:CHAT domain-containing protein/lipoprotein NlpI